MSPAQALKNSTKGCGCGVISKLENLKYSGHYKGALSPDLGQILSFKMEKKTMEGIGRNSG